MTEAKKGILDPQGLMRLYTSALAPRVLATAFELDIFSLIGEGHEGAEALARAAGASLRGTRMLLNALSALGIIEKEGERFRLFPESRPYLVRSSPDYVGALMAGDELWQSWGRLTEAIRSGLPVHEVESQEHAESFFPILIKSLHVLNREPARRLAAVLGAGRTHKGMRVLDIGCGSAVWSLAVAQADPEARVVAQDFPGVLAETSGFVAREGFGERFEMLPGDFNTVPFGKEAFDLAFLGNIVHSLGEDQTRRLFRRLCDALRGKGRLAIVDILPDEDRAGPAPAVLFALNMLVNTEKGDTYTLSEYRAWLAEAGFAAVETADIGDHLGASSPAVIAEKA